MALISAGPQVMHGRAAVAGTRVPVSVILDCLAAGMAAEEIVAEYPAVSVAGVRAAAAYSSVGYCESAILDRTLSLQGEDLSSASC
jgi:uncharacterized protein (DUF433 family)